MLNNKNLSKKSQSGVTMIEYALLAALIAVAAVVTMAALGTGISAKFTYILGCLDGTC